MTRSFICFLGAAAWLLSTLAFGSDTRAKTGQLSGGLRYEIPASFKESFLEMAEDAEEAAQAGKHVLLYMHLDECPYCGHMLEESFVSSDYAAWIPEHFDSIAVNIKGAREIAFNAELTVTEKELAEALKVRYTPTIVFLDGDNQPVLRTNGYRSASEFKDILNFVNSKAYQSSDLTSYLAKVKQQRKPRYAFPPNRHFSAITDLSRTADKPIMVIFEDHHCEQCAGFQRDLRHTKIDPLLEKFTVVRVDANSTTPITTPAGKSTTAVAWARALELDYRPGVVLFDGGDEIMRIDGMLRLWHLNVALRYIGERHYMQYQTMLDYGRVLRQATLNAGINIDYWE